MKIIKEKNLLFSNQPKPILDKDITKQLPAKKATRKLNYESEIEFNIFLSTREKPQIELNQDKKGAQVRIKNFKLGEHIFPPNIKV